MKFGVFELQEPLPQLREPHALATLHPWVDIGSAGSLTMGQLEKHLGAKPLGHLARPGNFFDFTRYRPTIYTEAGQRRVAIPNTMISYSQQAEGNDFLFLHLMEPHALGEDFVDSILSILDKFQAKRYCLLGSMYDLVPHTRPLRVTGSATGAPAEEALKRVDIKSSTYQGPTTIMALISQEATKRQMETMSMIVHLPQYAPLDDDRAGQLCLLKILCSLYGLTIDLRDIEQKATQQYAEINRAVEHNPQVKEMVSQLEKFYEYRLEQESGGTASPLSPEVEKFLKDISKQFGQN